MEKLCEVIRPMDVVLAVLLSAIGVGLMVENMRGEATATSASTPRPG